MLKIKVAQKVNTFGLLIPTNKVAQIAKFCTNLVTLLMYPLFNVV
jgi:hypothetical protein